MSFARLTAAVVLALGVTQAMGAALTRRVTCATGQTTANAACCALFPVVELLQNDLFDGAQCGEEAHSALRLTFNDAIGFSVNGGKGGGADGSILQFNTTEEAFSGNVGIDDITARQFPVFLQSGLSAGDFVHLAGAVGTANCPGAPRLQFLFGRPPPTAPAVDGTVPLSSDDAATILARFADAGFSAQEVVALLAAHTIGASDFIDPTIPGTPFDSTIGTFDSQFFLEVLLTGTLFPGAGPNPGEALSPIAGEMRLQSDMVIARDASTACFWEALVNNQQSMNSQFQAAMAKMQTLGQDVSQLVDCSDVIPVPQAFTSNIEFPPTLTASDLQLNCNSFTFPNLATAPGPAITVAPVPGS